NSGRDLCLTNNLRVTPNACRFHSGLNFVFTAQWFSLGVLALSHLNWALASLEKLEFIISIACVKIAA
ncbi:hypothetical protein, partial [Vibrio sp. 03-59-1]|uniref:hypothetical protein n=1 Tax=Vibrio sp. 03-59-1 TaxID=2607607 RepID=UPI001C1008FF